MTFQVVSYLKGRVVSREATVEEIAEMEARSVEVVVPKSVTRRQALQALMLNGYLEMIPVLLNGIADPVEREMAKIEWNESLEFERSRPLVIRMATALSISTEALDHLFIQASKL